MRDYLSYSRRVFPDFEAHIPHAAIFPVYTVLVGSYEYLVNGVHKST